MRSVGMVIFPGFEVLDVFGPMEMFGKRPEDFELSLVAEAGGPVESAQRIAAHADCSTRSRSDFDILMVPGGAGTRREVDNADLLTWIETAAQNAEFVLTICTGSALLARTGLLDGRHATSNKAAFAWVRSQGPKVLWEPAARWVEDGNILTSSGISAGMDMALRAISIMQGQETAEQIAIRCEYEWHQDASWDPFAKRHGLV